MEHLLEPFQIQTTGAHEVEQDPGVNGTTTRSHGQAIYCGKTHRRGDTLEAAEGTHARPIAKVRHDRALKLTVAVKPRQN